MRWFISTFYDYFIYIYSCPGSAIASDVIGDDVITKSHAICVLTAKSQFFARNLLNTYNFTMDSTYFVDFKR